MKNAIEKAQVVGRLLLRAPALAARVAFEGRGAGDLPSVRGALSLAGPGLDDQAGARARARHVARMAFRTAPSGLFCGVAVGELGAKTAIASGGAGQALLTVGRARLLAAARALLDDEALREQVGLRRAPSLLSDGEQLVWLSREAEVERAPIDPLLRAVLDATAAPVPWTELRATLLDALSSDDPVAIDDLLLQLVDGGLLCDDLAPPLHGPPSLAWLSERLARIAPPPGMAEVVGALDQACGSRFAADDPKLPSHVARLLELAGSLPGAAQPRPLAATLVLSPSLATLSRTAIDRAAALAPLLFRLSHALTGPTGERDRLPLVEAATHTLVELHEPGAFALADLELGAHGVAIAEAAPPLAADLPSLPDPPGDAPVTLPAALLRLLVEKLAAARDGSLALTRDELEAVLPPLATPDSFELILAPCREPRRAPDGTDWLLGLHGPAGSSWGRFAGALGAPLRAAFDELFAVEERCFPGAIVADLAYAPEAVSEVAVHPPLRPATIALSSWPEGGEALAPADLELIVRSDGDIALQHKDGRAIRPSQLSRVRSTTVGAEGAHRLLVAFALQRAVAPWAFHAGALELPRMPRVTVEGFVIAPASWRIPGELLAACRDGRGRAAIAKWRAAEDVPARVQIGFEDQLLPLALDAPGAAEELASLAGDGEAPRIYEIWPPLDRLPDRDGRRVEAIVAVVIERDRAPPATVKRVATGAAPGWRSWKIFAPPDRADRLLAGVVLPAVDGARAAGEIDRWFFLRYLDGDRHHLRVRVRGDGASFERRLIPFLDGKTRVEAGAWYPERLRYGGEAGLAVVEEAFQSDSDLAAALVALDPEARPPGGDLLARSFDALARGIGLPGDERRALANSCRARVAGLLRPEGSAGDPLAAWYRQRQAAITAALAADAGGDSIDVASPLFAAHAQHLSTLARAPLEAALPSLLHLAAVRLCGPGAAREAAGYYLWQRALESLSRRWPDQRR